ncbi:MAG: D-2-hydroxyacid dehydrogenase family protein [Verrucomicrobia bacterium]|nr:D-2-hydroxyacid dehydrogenase family protein [Verrucomicrobiota bacterium]
MKIAVLDDYQNIALTTADWSSIPGNPEIRVFNDHVSGLELLVQRLLPYDALCIMRERTPMTAALLDRLPNLKLIASTGSRNAAIDLEAAKRRAIDVRHTGYSAAPTIEFTWALILALARNLTLENASLRNGGWQVAVGADLHGKTLGVLGLGNIGSRVAAIGRAFGMNVIAWSQNLIREKAEAAGARLVSKDELFREADILTIHLVLSARSRGTVGKSELGLMKPTSFLINTARGPIVDEEALIEVLTNRKIAGAAIDVFDREPLPAEHPFRHLSNVLATPHLGYGTWSLYNVFYQDTVTNIKAWISEKGLE